jgi:hypothetical protein
MILMTHHDNTRVVAIVIAMIFLWLYKIPRVQALIPPHKTDIRGTSITSTIPLSTPTISITSSSSATTLINILTNNNILPLPIPIVVTSPSTVIHKPLHRKLPWISPPSTTRLYGQSPVASSSSSSSSSDSASILFDIEDSLVEAESNRPETSGSSSTAPSWMTDDYQIEQYIREGKLTTFECFNGALHYYTLLEQ